jgi:hypothetical protein
MSQPTTANTAPAGPESRVKHVTWAKDCALLLGGPCGPVIASATSLGRGSRISAKLIAQRRKDEDPWMGFSLFLPLGDPQALEAAGFGVRQVGMFFRNHVLESVRDVSLTCRSQRRHPEGRAPD